jgi:uncharacterized membrane protein YkoI
MTGRIGRIVVGSTAAVAIALAVPVGAMAATGHHAHHSHASKATKANASGSSTSTSPETALTGTTLASASAAALAAVPGTVASATTETDGTGAYEVIVTKSDGSRAKVVEDASFTVLSTAATNCR